MVSFGQNSHFWAFELFLKTSLKYYPYKTFLPWGQSGRLSLMRAMSLGAIVPLDKHLFKQCSTTQISQDTQGQLMNYVNQVGEGEMM